MAPVAQCLPPPPYPCKQPACFQRDNVARPGQVYDSAGVICRHVQIKGLEAPQSALAELLRCSPAIRGALRAPGSPILGNTLKTLCSNHTK